VRCPLDHALSALAQALHVPSIGADVDRVDVDEHAALYLELERGRARRWFRFAAGTLTELEPRADAALPIARELSVSGASGAAPEVLAWRPGRRLVLARADGTIAKGYRRRRSASAVRAQQIAESAASSGGFRVARMLAHRAEQEVMILERLTGTPLVVERSGSETFFALGVALRSLQEAPVGAELEAFEPEQELGVLDRWAERARSVLGELPGGWRAARAAVDEAAGSSSAGELGLAHRDLHDRQVLVTPAGLALFDHDLCARADVALDPANLLAHLALRAAQRLDGATEESVQLCGDALLEGLNRSADEGFWQRLRFYQATSFLRLALVHAIRPRWRTLAEPLVALGRRCLDDVVRA
jgi:hypothetical protein